MAELAKKSLMRMAVVRHWVRALRAEGACHISGWEQGSHGAGRRNTVPIFAAGAGPDVPLTACSMPAANVSTELKRDLYRDLVLAAMPGSRSEIAAATGMSKGTAGKWIDELHAAGKCHVGRWKRPEKGPHMPIYEAGAGNDRPNYIKPFTEAQKARRYRAKARADGTWEDRNRKLRTNAQADRAASRRDPMIESLFGPAKKNNQPAVGASPAANKEGV